ncbi:hypothetical protein KO507_19830 [Gilvimarinus agarilyticus]|uniref:hypothetical protein n=1 Tax=Reichenbachiella agariperforans TaxID=156994 RepID=UPI001C09CB5B|nr:hypothetical protein [Reichenbachiella agariperforans]MBU2888025.1 hypothetical protein [Gilvimarinus agarilyticus]MBU2915173.1 hypothetical protein [Reichenbachiella agariperforans]
MATIHVTLVVDTATLTSNPSDVPGACLLYDSTVTDPEGSTDFQINANEGDDIIFHISAYDNATLVLLTGITAKEGQANLFRTNPAAPSWKGTVGTANGTEAFNIMFSTGGTTYTLDPIIRVPV